MNYKEVLKCLKMPNYVSNDFYSMLFARSIGGTAGYDELTGTPPLTFTANGENLLDYRIYGANDGVGEQTNNLFDFESGMLDAANWTPIQVGNYSYFMYYLLSEDTTNRLKRIGNIAGTVYLIAGGSYYNGEVLAITSSMMPLVAPEYRLLQNDGTSRQYSADVSGYSDIYLCIGYGPGILPSNKQILIDSFFNSYHIMLNAGVVPLSYEPFGYQINAEVGDSVTTTDIPIYIGDTPLAQGEYVDYDEQKVYKYVDSTLTPTDPPVALPALPTIDGATIVDFDNTPKPSEMYIKYPK